MVSKFIIFHDQNGDKIDDLLGKSLGEVKDVPENTSYIQYFEYSDDSWIGEIYDPPRPLDKGRPDAIWHINNRELVSPRYYTSSLETSIEEKLKNEAETLLVVDCF